MYKILFIYYLYYTGNAKNNVTFANVYYSKGNLKKITYQHFYRKKNFSFV